MYSNRKRAKSEGRERDKGIEKVRERESSRLRRKKEVCARIDIKAVP